ncbi:MAG TPA: DsbC family protein [Nitrospirota bacterium]|nr:DsbC family protein [Nitrospirota bacterium]
MRRFQSVTILAAVLLMFFFAPASQAAGKSDKNVAECPQLDKKEADAIVKKVIPDGNAVDVKESPVKGVWQIDVEKGGQRGFIYLDCSRKYLVQLISLDAYLKQMQAQQTPRKVDFSKIPLGDSITVGSKTATKKVIVFSDPDCPYCRKLHESIEKIIAKRPDIAFVEILHPLPMHKDSPKKVQAILCSKSVEMLDDAFSGKPVPEPPANCTTEAMERNIALARSLNFNGTPTLVRDDGTVMSGAPPEDKLLEWIDKKP